MNAPTPSSTTEARQRERRIVASYSNYAEAERAVDRLADSGFPVERTSIVARGLRWEEQVTGRLRWIDAAIRGALSGAIVGFLVGWLFGVFDWFNPLISSAWLAFDGLWFGTLVGSLAGIIAHALMRGRRDFASVGAITADRYDVLVDAEVADEAERLLTTTTTNEQTTPRDEHGGAANP
jgi:hypothetical protein